MDEREGCSEPVPTKDHSAQVSVRELPRFLLNLPASIRRGSRREPCLKPDASCASEGVELLDHVWRGDIRPVNDVRFHPVNRDDPLPSRRDGGRNRIRYPATWSVRSTLAPNLLAVSRASRKCAQHTVDRSRVQIMVQAGLCAGDPRRPSHPREDARARRPMDEQVAATLAVVGRSTQGRAASLEQCVGAGGALPPPRRSVAEHPSTGGASGAR